MKPGIYEAFDSAFKRVSAYALIDCGAVIGRVAVKYPADGMGRATLYLQVWGLEMVRGSASGCGYDKTTAAAWAAGRNLAAVAASERADSKPEREKNLRAIERAESIAAALVGDGDGGTRWDSRLQAAGFTVQGVI